ncbi:hypothetical protein AB0H18_05995 [Streptomyces sp. NPDC020766]|uniref:hypothetical protein n=1 Tax=Streptomyces sp. NPDC020766 TaxID=3155011 RepID=UPI0033C90397
MKKPKVPKCGGVISGLLAVGLLGVFIALAVYVAITVDNPPRLADVAPTIAPSPSPDGSLPAQHRGGFDPNTRLLGVIAIVAPLLTTIVGFFFGQRVGQAQGETATQEAQTNQAQIARALYKRQQPDIVEALKSQGLIDPKIDPP